MIQFNELRITPDGAFLIIDISIINDTRYKDATLSHIIIDNLDSYLDNGPSDNPVYSYVVPTPDYNKVYTKDCNVVLAADLDCYIEGENLVKSVRLRLKVKDLENISTLKDNIFFVYVIAEMTSPCGRDSFTKMSTVTYLYPLYKNIMKYIGQLNDTCTIPHQLIDSILRMQSIEAALKSGNYNTAIKYWNKFHLEDTNASVKNSCGCYGKY